MLDNFRAANAAQKDVAAGIPLDSGRELFVTAVAGTQPAAGDATDPKAMRATDALANRTVVGELEADERIARSASSPWGWAVGLVVWTMVGVEIAGVFDLLEGLGIDDVTRALLAVAITAVLLAVTFLAADSIKTASVTGDGQPRKMPLWHTAALGLYVLLVVAATALRFDVLGSRDDATAVSDWAGAILLLGATLGPAWALKILMPMWTIARAQGRDVQRAAQARKAAQTNIASAERLIDQRHAEPAAWQSRAARLRALYETAYRRAAGRSSK